jgi:hypothetical protein
VRSVTWRIAWVAAIISLVLSPFVAAAPAQAGAPTSDGVADLVRRVPLPDGTTHVTVIPVPEGTTAQRLYAELTAAGVTNLMSPHQVSAALAAPCTWGHAEGFDATLWPCIRWANNGWSDPQVYFRDWTPANWPVDVSVYEWNKAVGVDSYYIWHTTACPSTSTGKHCVNVYDATCPVPGLANKVGCTDYRITSGNLFIDGSVKVYLNTALDGNGEDNRGTACHELGHALGVGHNQGEKSTSCLAMTKPGPDNKYPSVEDYGLLKCRVYPPFPAGC